MQTVTYPPLPGSTLWPPSAGSLKPRDTSAIGRNHRQLPPAREPHAEGGVSAEGSGALAILPSGEEFELRAAAGKTCSSTRAELVALLVALEIVPQMENDPAGSRLVVCTDS